MAVSQTLLPEFDNEMTTTRALLERVPAEKAAWKPHAKSWSLGELSMHVANVLSWGRLTLETTEFDVAPPGGPAYKSPPYVSPARTLEVFDANRDGARAAIVAARDEDLGVLWSLKQGGKTKFSMPRSLCLRTFVLNHLIHHRGQLTVYLRQCDVALPSVYGPTADTPV